VNDVVRLGDAIETAVACRTIIERPGRPAGLCLTRQELPVLDRSADGPGFGRAEGTARGGYVLAEADGGTRWLRTGRGRRRHAGRYPDRNRERGTDRARRQEPLPGSGVAARVVSMPCLEWFTEQDDDYREHVLPASVHARVSLTLGWREYVGDAGASVGLEHFGASADYKRLYAEFGITAGGPRKRRTPASRR
jgi:transketolase